MKHSTHNYNGEASLRSGGHRSVGAQERLVLIAFGPDDEVERLEKSETPDNDWVLELDEYTPRTKGP